MHRLCWAGHRAEGEECRPRDGDNPRAPVDKMRVIAVAVASKLGELAHTPRRPAVEEKKGSCGLETLLGTVFHAMLVGKVKASGPQSSSDSHVAKAIFEVHGHLCMLPELTSQRRLRCLRAFMHGMEKQGKSAFSLVLACIT